MAVMTWPWKLAGMPRWFSCVMRLACSCEYTSEPRIATPVTAPISRLVLVAEAAMPDRSAGTAVSTDEVTGTTVVPMPMLARRARRPAARRTGAA